jgi:hypothetical protein
MRCADWRFQGSHYGPMQPAAPLATFIISTATTMGCVPTALLTSTTLQELAVVSTDSNAHPPSAARTCFIPPYVEQLKCSAELITSGLWAPRATAAPMLLPSLSRLNVPASAAGVDIQDLRCQAGGACVGRFRALSAATLPQGRVCGSGVLGRAPLQDDACGTQGERHRDLSAKVLVLGSLMLPVPPELGDITSGAVALAIANGLAAAGAASASDSLSPQLVGKPTVDGIHVWDAPVDTLECGTSAAAATPSSPLLMEADAVTSLILCGVDLGVPSNKTLRAVVLSPRKPARIFRIRGQVLADAAPLLACAAARSGRRRLLQDTKPSPGDASRLLSSGLANALAGDGRTVAHGAFLDSLQQFWPEAGLQDRQGGPPVPVESIAYPFSKLTALDGSTGSRGKRGRRRRILCSVLVPVILFAFVCICAAMHAQRVIRRRRGVDDSEENTLVPLEKDILSESRNARGKDDPGGSAVWSAQGSLPSSRLSSQVSSGVMMRRNALKAIVQPPGVCPPPSVQRRSRRRRWRPPPFRGSSGSGGTAAAPAAGATDWRVPTEQQTTLDRLLRSLVCACVAPREDREAQEQAFDSVRQALIDAQKEVSSKLPPLAPSQPPPTLFEVTPAQMGVLLASPSSVMSRPTSSSSSQRTSPDHLEDPLAEGRSGSGTGTRVFLPSITLEAAHAKHSFSASDSWMLNLAANPIGRYKAFLHGESALLNATARHSARRTHPIELCRTHRTRLFSDDPFGLYWTAPLQPPMLFAYLACADCPVRSSHLQPGGLLACSLRQHLHQPFLSLHSD